MSNGFGRNEKYIYHFLIFSSAQPALPLFTTQTQTIRNRSGLKEQLELLNM
jgi:hypothetical protein